MSDIKPSGKPKLVVSLLDESQEFQAMQGEDARRVAAELGYEAQVLYAENTTILQIQQLYKAIQAPEEQRPKVILLESVTGEGLERVARAAVAAKVGWVLINRNVSYMEHLRREHRSLPISTVSTDQVETGRIQGRQFRALIPSGEGVVLYVQGPADTSAAQERLQGAREELSGTRIELKVIDGRWTVESGEQAVDRWLRLKRLEKIHIDVVGCQNDAMAAGARRALLSHAELSSVPVTGVDGVPEVGQRLVRAGELTATVIVPSNTGPAIRHVVRALQAGTGLAERIVLQPLSFPDLHDIETRARSSWALPSSR